MNREYYLVWGDTTPGPYTLQEIVVMLERNQISPAHQVIHLGKTMLVSELIASLPAEAVAAARYVPAYAETYFYILEPLILAVAALNFVRMCITITILFITQMAGILNCLFVPLYLLSYFAYVVLFYVWSYRVHLNARAFGATDLYFTAPWTIASWFVPFLNYVWPFMAIKEILQASKDPHDWRQQSAVIVYIWWASFVLMALIALAGGVSLVFYKTGDILTALKDPQFLRMVQLFSIPTSVANILYCVLSWLVIRSIHTHQSYLSKNGQPMPAGSRNMLSL